MFALRISVGRHSLVRSNNVLRSFPERDLFLDERIRVTRALFSSNAHQSGSSSRSSPTQTPSLQNSPSFMKQEESQPKSKEEIAAKLKQALQDSSKQPKKKPTVSPTQTAVHSSGPSAPPTGPLPVPETQQSASDATTNQLAVKPTEAQIKRESTFERLGQRIKRAFTDASKADTAVGLDSIPPPGSVRVDPHIVTRSQVTPARNVIGLTRDLTVSALKASLLLPGMLGRGLLWIGRGTFKLIKDPSLIPKGSSNMWKSIKHEAHHYWTGFKVFSLELKTAWQLLTARLQGKDLTRREQQQLKRTFTDVLRMGPFLVFVIVPFMEFTLPIFLKLFPNMLPSPFIDEKQKQMTQKNVGQLRKEMASFMQEMVADVETKVRDKGADAKALSALVEFVDCSRNNLPIRPELIPILTKTFSDELTIERMSREQLQMMCRFMGVSTIGSDDFLRYSLLSRLRGVRQDDVLISWEGVESLNLEELKHAALERGMQAESNDIQYYRKLLARWIELSVVHNVSPAMLILSRAFALSGPTPQPASDAQESIKQVLSSLEEDIVQDAIVSAVDDIANQPKIESKLDRTVLQKAKLESIKRENELIEEEEKGGGEEHKLKLQQQTQLKSLADHSSNNKALPSSQQTVGKDDKGNVVKMTPIPPPPSKPSLGTPSPNGSTLKKDNGLEMSTKKDSNQSEAGL